MRTIPVIITIFLLTFLSWDAAAAQKPGPSQALFSAPYYSCLKNYYVSLAGSDANSGTSPDAPWLTLQHANDIGRTAGDCVNVAPGTYTHGVLINSGGNRASSTGYVVYRCTTMDACIITDVSAGGENGSFAWNTSKQPMTGSYVMVDGFTLKAASETLFGQGIQLFNGTNNYVPSVHHVWIMNSIISGYGQAGVNMNNGEYFYVIHNTVFNNANVGCSAQGSGIAFVIPIAVAGYVPVADDLKNPVVGKIGSSFHNAVEWNVVYNNATTKCGTASNPYDTDGNNIIMDTFNWDVGLAGTTPYTGGVLIAFNITFNAGGGGIHIFKSEYVTAANNSCYNNYLDPYNVAAARACIDTLGSYGNTIINNIAVGVAANHSTCGYYLAPYTMWNNAIIGSPPSTASPPDVFTNNISYVVGSSCSPEASVNNGDTYSCTSNKCGTFPGWEGVGNTSTGNETVPPVGVNFALRPGSPAIGYGLTTSYLPSSSVDVGACASALQTCP